MERPHLVYTYPDPLLRVYSHFEAYCVGACCGYEAFDINAHRLIELVQADGVEQLAKSIVRTRVFGDSPVLADALEEAGCNNMDLLTRCRAVPPEAAANWVANLLVLGAEGTFDRQIEPTSN